MNKRIFLYLTVLCLVACMLINSLFLTVFAQDSNLPEPPALEGVNAVYFYNITEDKLIASQNENEKVNTSTSAKIMMGLIACEELGGRLSDKITVTGEMIANVQGMKLGFSVGDQVSVSDLLYAAICGSYNDAAYIIAHVIAGNPNEFASLMTKKAHKLGAVNTKYTNPIGYPDNSAMLTTARDVSKIALAAYKNTLYMEISSCLKYTASISSGEKEFYNKNYLIATNATAAYRNEKCSGMNVGYTGEAGGYSLVTVASDGDQKYLCVILGGEESDDGKIYAYIVANKLISWACAEYQTVSLYKKGEEIGLVEIGLTGSSNHAPYVTANELNVYLPKNATYDPQSLTRQVELLSDSFNAPIEAGTKVGVLKIYYNGECVGRCDLVLSESYKQNPILSGINKISEYMASRAFIFTVISFAVSLPIVLLIIRRGDRRGSRRKYRK